LIYFDNPKSHKLANHPHSANRHYKMQYPRPSFSYVSNGTKMECYELLSQGQTVTEDQLTIMAFEPSSKGKLPQIAANQCKVILFYDKLESLATSSILSGIDFHLIFIYLDWCNNLSDTRFWSTERWRKCEKVWIDE